MNRRRGRAACRASNCCRRARFQVFEDQVLAGTKGANQPTQQMLEARDHGENLIELLPVEPVAKSLYLQMQDVLRIHRRAKVNVSKSDFMLCNSPEFRNHGRVHAYLFRRSR